MIAVQEITSTYIPPLSVAVRKAICGGVHNKDHTTDLSTVHEIRDSDPSLPFFERRDATSEAALTICAGCHFNRGGHAVYGVLFSGEHEFTPHGEWEFDSFYCGHSGWD